MRTLARFPVTEPDDFKLQLLQWAQSYDTILWLDSNGHIDRYSSFECLLGVGVEKSLISLEGESFALLRKQIDEIKDWFLGYLTYDLKNEIEDLNSENRDELNFPAMFFFQPKKIIRCKENIAEFIYLSQYADEIEDDFRLIKTIKISPARENPISVKIKMRTFKDAYFSRVKRLLSHIQRGDIYEANFCQEFYSEGTAIDPLAVYRRLNELARPPFASFLKTEYGYVLSSSPERFLKKEGSTIISQPIKGTAKRSLDPETDGRLKDQLASDIKERAENIMIVDLVRNDLSKHATKGSVKVSELCQIYTYKQVHQMVSTIEAQVASSTHVVDLIKDSFPMGSMTGAPKLSAMQLIESSEYTKRGVYSGALGYFTPSQDFDFSVVIRTILYNPSTKYLSFSVGSAITAKANPESEYEECLVKAKAMRSVLEKKTDER